MKGKRISAMRQVGRHLSREHGSRRTGEKKRQRKKKWMLIPVALACMALVFVLFPGTAGAVTQKISEFLGRGADFREAFSAVGRAVGGKDSVEDSLKDAYTAVFNPEPMEDPTGESDLAADSPKEDEESSEGLELTSGSDVIPSLPDNASLALRNLGFSYTTPVKGVLTSAFGWRSHPDTGELRFHYGVDFAANTGTEIVAFADGEVLAVGESSTLGKYIILLHPGGYRTLYAHCSRILKSDGTVAKGEAIACVGQTGTATGPHLHFELQNGSVYLNPMYYVAIW